MGGGGERRGGKDVRYESLKDAAKRVTKAKKVVSSTAGTTSARSSPATLPRGNSWLQVMAASVEKLSEMTKETTVPLKSDDTSDNAGGGGDKTGVRSKGPTGTSTSSSMVRSRSKENLTYFSGSQPGSSASPDSSDGSEGEGSAGGGRRKVRLGGGDGDNGGNSHGAAIVGSNSNQRSNSGSGYTSDKRRDFKSSSGSGTGGGSSSGGGRRGWPPSASAKPRPYDGSRSDATTSILSNVGESVPAHRLGAGYGSVEEEALAMDLSRDDDNGSESPLGPSHFSSG